MPRDSSLSGLRVDRDGAVTKENFKAHLARLQQELRDIQEEMRTLTGGGRSTVPGGKTTNRTPFKLSTSKQGTADANVEVQGALRTGTKSRAQHDLVTRKELNQATTQASTSTGFMDLTTNQVVASGNKDFGSISFQIDTYDLTPGSSYPEIDLSGATFWRLQPTSSAAGVVTVHSFSRPGPDKNMLRILLWTGYNSNLQLVHNSTAAGDTNGKIDTLAATSAADTNTPVISTTKTGAFILLYSIAANRWNVIARSA